MDRWADTEHMGLDRDSPERWQEQGRIDGGKGRKPAKGAPGDCWLGYAYAYAAAQAPAIPGCHSPDDLIEHYRPWGGDVRATDDGFVVYLAKLRRKHHYRYEAPGPIGKYPYTFAGEGYHA